MYRDGLEGLREAVRQQREIVGERDRNLAGLRRAVLDDAEHADLERRRKACFARDPKTLEDVTQLGADLDAFDAALAEAERVSARLLDVAECEPPFDASDAPRGWRPGDWPSGLDLALGRLAERCRGPLTPWGNGWGIQFTYDGATLVLRGTCETLDATHQYACLTLWSGTSATLPKLALRPQTIGDRLAKLVHLAGDADVGEPRFDGKFWVSGREDVARALLVPEIRDALVSFPPGPPLFKIDGGLAKLSWMIDPKSYEHTTGIEDDELVLPRAALEIHRVLRETVRAARER